MNRQSITKLAHQRARRELTQKQLAEKAGVSTATVQRLESGKNAARLTTLYRLARALEVRPADLLEENVLEEAS